MRTSHFFSTRTIHITRQQHWRVVPCYRCLLYNNEGGQGVFKWGVVPETHKTTLELEILVSKWLSCLAYLPGCLTDNLSSFIISYRNENKDNIPTVLTRLIRWLYYYMNDEAPSFSSLCVISYYNNTIEIIVVTNIISILLWFYSN